MHEYQHPTILGGIFDCLVLDSCMDVRLGTLSIRININLLRCLNHVRFRPCGTEHGSMCPTMLLFCLFYRVTGCAFGSTDAIFFLCVNHMDWNATTTEQKDSLQYVKLLGIFYPEECILLGRRYQVCCTIARAVFAVVRNTGKRSGSECSFCG